MRKGILGSIAALAAGAGTAWGQSPGSASAGDPPAPAAVAPPTVIPAQAQTSGPFGGLFAPASPAPVIMPPLASGPPGDPQGLGPIGGYGPPPGPMYPNPGPYSAPAFQPGPPPGNGGSYGQAPHWWTSVDYLLFFAKGQPSNFPLLTTSAPVDQGLLGHSSTLPLAGGQNMSYNPISGFRAVFGFFGDADRRWGFEATGVLFESKGNVTSVSSSSSIPTLALPFIDSTNPHVFTSQLVANPNYGQGQAIIGTTNQTWWTDADGIVNIYRSEPGRKIAFSMDFLAGYKYLQVREDLTIDTHTTLNQMPTMSPVFALGPFGVVTQVGTTTTAAQVPFGGVMISPPATVLTRDSFLVTNRFNGGQVGLRGEVRCGMFTVNATGKLSIGDMNERLQITGASAFTDITRPVGGLPNTGSAFGGVYANASNIGRYNHDEFAVIPEVNMNIGLNLTRSITAYLGYNFIYINNIARPGEQINPIINTATIPFNPAYGAAGQPNVVQNLFTQSNFWMMGVNFGMMMRY
ncbi:MAG TPA: BBP7 family outer membrane beta-barrel protein [Gemmataceae bacterium]